MQPKDIYALFDRNVPVKLIDCIADLLKYDPDIRLTSLQCLQHPYLLETTPLNNPPGPPTQTTQTTQTPASCRQEARNGVTNGIHSNTGSNTSLPSIAPRNIPPSHSHPNGNPRVHPPALQIPPPHLPDASSTHRTPFYSDSGFASAHSRSTSEYSGDVGYSPHAVQGWLQKGQTYPDDMDVSPQVEAPSQRDYVEGPHHPMDIQSSPMAQEYPSRPAHEPDPPQNGASGHPAPKFPKLSSLGFPKKTTKWGLGMFGHSDKAGQQQLPPVQENLASASTPSLKRRESSSTDSHSLPEMSPVTELPRPLNSEDEKQRNKRIAKELQKEAERQRRLRAEKMQREQARAVMKNQRRLAQTTTKTDILWNVGPHGMPGVPAVSKGKQPAATGPIRQAPSHASSPTINAAGGSFKGASASPAVPSPQDSSATRVNDWQMDSGRLPKARKRDYDDDHSMSSDMHGRMSVISFATVDSDPGPTRLMHRQGAYGMNRMTSMSSLRSSVDDFPTSERSSASLSLEQQLVQDFHLRASVDSSSISDGGSPQPPPMHMLSLSSPIPWQHSHSEMSSTSTVDNRSVGSSRRQPPMSPPPQPQQPGAPHLHLGPRSPYDSGSSQYGPPSPAINPMFKVVRNPPFGDLEWHR